MNRRTDELALRARSMIGARKRSSPPNSRHVRLLVPTESPLGRAFSCVGPSWRAPFVEHGLATLSAHPGRSIRTRLSVGENRNGPVHSDPTLVPMLEARLLLAEDPELRRVTHGQHDTERVFYLDQEALLLCRRRALPARLARSTTWSLPRSRPGEGGDEPAAVFT